MKNLNTNIADKTSELVEKHSFLATLLAVLCLAFAVNFFISGPGSDGGSGLGGTGKLGGESGLGGTGKGPDFGSSFKLGAADSTDQDQEKEEAHLSLAEPLERLVAELTPPAPAVFEAANLRLTPETIPASLHEERGGKVESIENPLDGKLDIASLVEKVKLDSPTQISQYLADDKNTVAATTLVSSLDILNSLMLAESQTSIEHLASIEAIDSTTDSAADSAIRNRIAVPVRPERPDRLSVPSRITPVQRVNIPAPPPVRPMRTLSAILNH